jgi:ADP-ribosylglycohydrolase
MDKNEAIDWAIAETTKHLTNASADEVAEFQKVVAGEHVEQRGSGYVVDSLWSAIMAFTSGNSYEDVVRRAIAFGLDTDTTACIAGGLAGIFYGYDSIPVKWIDHLRGRDIVDPLAANLLAHHGMELDGE